MAKNWIGDAINPKHKGQLRKELGAKPGKPISEAALTKAEKAPGKLGRQARLANTLRGMSKRGK